VHSFSYDGQVTELTQMVDAGGPGVGCDAGRAGFAMCRIPGRTSGISANTLENAGCDAAPNIRWRSPCWPTASIPRTCTPRSRPKRGYGAPSASSIRSALWWEAAAQPGTLIAAGLVSLSSAYTLWFDPEQEVNRHTRIVWRQNLYDIDSWAIPKGSSKRDEAYRFIAFASSPERQKALSEHVTYGPTNRNALELLPARPACGARLQFSEAVRPPMSLHSNLIEVPDFPA
jgi:hypothetical protein